MNQTDKRKYEFVVGIDLGHGETSAAYCALQWDTPEDQLEPTKDIEMAGNCKKIPSAITILPDGSAKIGESAFNTDILRQADVHVCFKKRPVDINGEAEQIMIRFMKEVYKTIREHATCLTDTNHVVCIATPSGWNAKDQQIYLEMAKLAGIPVSDFGVTKESRAAFVRAQHDTGSGLGRNIEKGAIVFDMGSSTLDFTYMSKAHPKPVDHGYDCGASFVEKAILAKLKRDMKDADDDALERFEARYPKLMDYILFQARELKEKYYFDPTLKARCSKNFDEFIEDEDFEDDRIKIIFKPGELDEFLREEGYLKQIEDAMLDFKNNYIKGQPIYGVFLTGGASRMTFIKDLVCKCWDVPIDMIYRDQDPSLTISEGVAEVARGDMRTSEMDTSLEQDIVRLQNSNEIYDIFVNTFGENLYTHIVNDMADAINGFASGGDASVNSLKIRISQAVSNAVKAESSRASMYMQEAVSQGVAPIQSKVEDIIKHYSQQGMNVQMKTVDISAPSIQGVNLNSIMNDVSTQIAASSSGWSETATNAAISFAAGFLFGPLGVLAAVGYALFSNNKSPEEKQREAMSKNLNAEQRQQVVNTISEQWEDIKRQIANSIMSSLQNQQSIMQSINMVTKQLLEDYKTNLKDARLLID